MAALAVSGADEGVWLRAERQTGGRGRMGRSWASTAGNLNISTLVHLRPTDPPAPQLALVAAIAAWESAQGAVPGRRIEIKWPNDLMADGAKLAGMLLERQGDAVIVGIGMNIVHAPVLPDRRATSLAELGAGADTDAATIAQELAERFAAWLQRWRDEGLAPVAQAWLAAAHPVGTPLRVVCPDGATWQGGFDGLTPDGALILALADGGRHVIHAGDVFSI